MVSGRLLAGTACLLGKRVSRYWKPWLISSKKQLLWEGGQVKVPTMLLACLSA